MGYDGQERRKSYQFCSAHEGVMITSATVSTKLDSLVESVKKIEGHMEDQSMLRSNWWITICGIIVGVLIQTSVFCYWLGQISKQIEVDHQSIQELWHKK